MDPWSTLTDPSEMRVYVGRYTYYNIPREVKIGILQGWYGCKEVGSGIRYSVTWRRPASEAGQNTTSPSYLASLPSLPAA